MKAAGNKYLRTSGRWRVVDSLISPLERLQTTTVSTFSDAQTHNPANDKDSQLISPGLPYVSCGTFRS